MLDLTTRAHRMGRGEGRLCQEREDRFRPGGPWQQGPWTCVWWWGDGVGWVRCWRCPAARSHAGEFSNRRGEARPFGSSSWACAHGVVLFGDDRAQGVGGQATQGPSARALALPSSVHLFRRQRHGRAPRHEGRRPTRPYTHHALSQQHDRVHVPHPHPPTSTTLSRLHAHTHRQKEEQAEEKTTPAASSSSTQAASFSASLPKR